MQPPFDQGQVRQRWAAQNPGVDTSPMEIIELLWRIVGQLERAVEPLYDAAYLTAGEIGLLIHLRYQDFPITASRLADMRHMSRAGVSKALQRLEGRGFVERIPDPRDKRASLVRMTQSGKDEVDDVFPRQLAVEAKVLAGLGDSRDKVLDALQLLAGVVESGMAASSLPQ